MKFSKSSLLRAFSLPLGLIVGFAFVQLLDAACTIFGVRGEVTRSTMGYSLSMQYQHESRATILMMLLIPAVILILAKSRQRLSINAGFFFGFCLISYIWCISLAVIEFSIISATMLVVDFILLIVAVAYFIHQRPQALDRKASEAPLPANAGSASAISSGDELQSSHAQKVTAATDTSPVCAINSSTSNNPASNDVVGDKLRKALYVAILVWTGFCMLCPTWSGKSYGPPDRFGERWRPGGAFGITGFGMGSFHRLAPIWDPPKSSGGIPSQVRWPLQSVGARNCVEISFGRTLKRLSLGWLLAGVLVRVFLRTRKTVCPEMVLQLASAAAPALAVAFILLALSWPLAALSGLDEPITVIVLVAAIVIGVSSWRVSLESE